MYTDLIQIQIYIPSLVKIYIQILAQNGQRQMHMYTIQTYFTENTKLRFKMTQGWNAN